MMFFFFFFNDTATTEIYTLSLHDALPIWPAQGPRRGLERRHPALPVALRLCAEPGSSRILQAERLAVVVVGEDFRVAAPADDGAQGLLGRFLGHVVLELIEEAALGRRVTGALVQHPAHVRGERHVGDEVADRKSTRLNSSHLVISYAVFCLKKKKEGNAISPDHSQHLRTCV